MAVNKRFEKLLEPYHIGSVKTRNRIIKTASGMFMWHEDELSMNEKVKAYYGSIARGGAGLVIVESVTIDWPYGRRWRERYRLDDDRYIKGLSELPEVIHGYGCPAFIQLVHEGPWQTRFPFMPEPLFEGGPVGASAVCLSNPNDFHNQEPRPLTVSEIEELIDKFASAAVRCAKAGFDGVDINAASTHLLHNFLSPFWNRRTDMYGGSTENRARFLEQIVREIKKRLGNDFAVEVIINGIEIGQASGIDNNMCLTPESARTVAKILESAGADAIQVRSHWLGFHQGSFLPEAFFYPEPPVPVKSIPREYNASHKGAGANIRLAAGIKKEVGIPVIVVGRMDANTGEEVLRRGDADFIGMTRRLQADPDYTNKLAADRPDDIAPCTACGTCLGANARCRINPFLGAENNTIEKAEKSKKVFVIGAGPAGMEAARAAALRGHVVTLFEKEKRIGGLLHVAAVVKGDHPEDLLSIVRYFESQFKHLGVSVKLGKAIGPDEIMAGSPDAVVIATGGSPVAPQITGNNSTRVVNGAYLHGKLKLLLRFLNPDSLRFLSRVFMPLGKRVAIIGGGLHGCELAEFLLKRGRKIIILESGDRLGEGMVDVLCNHLMIWFEKKGVVVRTGVTGIELTASGVKITSRDGSTEQIDADTVIPAVPLSPKRDLFESLEGKVPEVYAIGDCKSPRLIVDAIGDGCRIARAI